MIPVPDFSFCRYSSLRYGRRNYCCKLSSLVVRKEGRTDGWTMTTTRSFSFLYLLTNWISKPPPPSPLLSSSSCRTLSQAAVDSLLSRRNDISLPRRRQRRPLFSLRRRTFSAKLWNSPGYRHLEASKRYRLLASRDVFACRSIREEYIDSEGSNSRGSRAREKPAEWRIFWVSRRVFRRLEECLCDIFVHWERNAWYL